MIPVLVVICFRWFRLMAGRLYCIGILPPEIFSNSMACATAEFSQAVDTIFCKVFDTDIPSQWFIIKQSDNALSQLSGISKIKNNSGISCQYFLCMRNRCGNDGAATTHGINKCSAYSLIRIIGGKQVNICKLQIFEQIR